MPLLDQDLPWLLAEARNDPGAAQRIIEAFAERVQSLQRQMDELRAENALLKRTGGLQASNELTQRHKTNLRDLRQLAERHRLNRDIVTLMSFTGHAMQWPAPAPIEQTLPLATPPEEPVRDLKPMFLAAGARFGSVLAVTSGLRFGLVFGLSLPLSENVDWRDARPAAALGLARAERVEAVCAVDELLPPRQVILVTRRGWVRLMSWPLVENLSVSGQSITLPVEGDSPAWLGAGESEGDLLVLTRNGRWTRFPIGLIPPAGSLGVALDGDDDVVAAVWLGKDTPAVWFIGADGAMCAVAAGALEAHKKPGGKAAQLIRRFVALSCYPIHARRSDVALLLSNEGEFHVVNATGLPVTGKLSEVQTLNVINQRLVAATLL